MKRSSFLDTKFSCFFEMSFLGVVLNDEASHIIPPRYPHDLFWHWLLIRPIVIQCAYPWRDLSIIVNKSCQSFPCNNSWVLPRVRINQFHYLWWPPMFLVVNAFARSDDFVHMWILMFVPPRSENRLQLISFSKIWCLAELQFEMILWIVGFQLLEDFFESMKRSSFLDTKFCCFFEMSFLGVVLINEVSITIRVSWVWF